MNDYSFYGDFEKDSIKYGFCGSTPSSLSLPPFYYDRKGLKERVNNKISVLDTDWSNNLSIGAKYALNQRRLNQSLKNYAIFGVVRYTRWLEDIKNRERNWR